MSQSKKSSKIEDHLRHTARHICMSRRSLLDRIVTDHKNWIRFETPTQKNCEYLSKIIDIEYTAKIATYRNQQTDWCDLL